MARINRSDVIQKAVNDLAISTLVDKIPNETLEKVQLTYSLNKQFSNFIVTGTSSSSGTLTVSFPTVSAGSDTFITSLNLSFIKDATCDVGTGNLNLSIQPDGGPVSTSIFRFSVITLTAQNSEISIPLPFPLKIKNNTTMTLTGTFTLGVMVRSINAVGFTTSSN